MLLDKVWDVPSRMTIPKFQEMLLPTMLNINNLVLLLGKHRVTSQVKERIQLQVLVDMVLEGHKVKLMEVSFTDSTEGTHHLHIPLHHLLMFHFQRL